MYNNLFRKLWRLCDNVGKYCTEQAKDDNMLHTNCISVTHIACTLKIRNTYSFSTATMFARKRLHGTVKAYCLPCSQFATIIVTKIRALNQTKKL
jgi:hypothetical protein